MKKQRMLGAIIQVRIPVDLFRAMKRMGAIKNVSASEYIRRVLNQHVARSERKRAA